MWDSEFEILNIQITTNTANKALQFCFNWAVMICTLMGRNIWASLWENGSLGVPTGSDTHQAIQPHKIARGWKSRAWEVLWLHYVAKTKALISFAVTAKLTCVCIFAYAKIRFFMTWLTSNNISCTSLFWNLGTHFYLWHLSVVDFTWVDRRVMRLVS